MTVQYPDFLPEEREELNRLLREGLQRAQSKDDAVGVAINIASAYALRIALKYVNTRVDPLIEQLGQMTAQRREADDYCLAAVDRLKARVDQLEERINGQV